jgi:hypothetical protein
MLREIQFDCLLGNQHDKFFSNFCQLIRNPSRRLCLLLERISKPGQAPLQLRSLRPSGASPGFETTCRTTVLLSRDPQMSCRIEGNSEDLFINDRAGTTASKSGVQGFLIVFCCCVFPE